MNDSGGFYQIDNAILREYGPQIGVYGVAVYNVLAMYANGNGDGIYPAYQTIADQLGISRRKVIATIDDLCAIGLVVKTTRNSKSGKQTSNGYILPKHRGAPHAPQQETEPVGVHDMHHRGAQDAPSGVHDMHGRGAPHAPDQDPIDQYPSDQDPEEQEGARETVGLPVTLPARPRSKPPTVKGITESPYLKGARLVRGYVPEGTGVNAVQVYYERFSLLEERERLTPIQEDDLNRHCPNLERLREVMEAYSGAGYRAKNTKLIRDWYRDPSRYAFGGNGNGNGYHRPSKVDLTMQAFDNVEALLRKEGIQGWQ